LIVFICRRYKPRTNRSWIAMIFRSQSSFEGRLRGRGGGELSRFANTFTNQVMFSPEGCRANGFFDVSLMMSRAGQIMISHLNGNFRANAGRRGFSLTSSRTTNVPTAPMFTTPNLVNCFAICAGWHRFALPTFTARRNTAQRTREVRTKKKIYESENLLVPGFESRRTSGEIRLNKSRAGVDIDLTQDCVARVNESMRRVRRNHHDAAPFHFARFIADR